MKSEQQNLKEKIANHYELSKQLTPEYDKVYTDMVVYLRTSALTMTDVEEVINDILVMMLEAQDRGESAELVFGSDYKQFCDEMILSTGKGTIRNQAKDRLQILLPSINICLFFSWINTLNIQEFKNLHGLLTVNFSVAFILNMAFMLVGVFVVLRWIHVNIYSTDGNTLPEWRKALPGGVIFVVVVFLMAVVSRTLDKYVLMQFHVAWLLGLMGIVWIAGRVLNKKASDQ